MHSAIASIVSGAQPSDLQKALIADPLQRVGDFQTWSGFIMNYSVLLPDNPMTNGHPRAQIFFAKDGVPTSFNVFVAQHVQIDGKPANCASSQELDIQFGRSAMCTSLPKIHLQKTYVKLRVWFQVDTIGCGLMLLPFTDSITILRQPPPALLNDSEQDAVLRLRSG